MDDLHERFTRVENRVERVEERIGEIEERTTTLEADRDIHELRIFGGRDEDGERVVSLTEQMQTANAALAAINARMSAGEAWLKNQGLSALKWGLRGMWATLVAVVLAATWIIAHLAQIIAAIHALIQD